MVPRISSKEAKAMYDAYSKVYAPKEEPKPETEASAEEPAEKESESINVIKKEQCLSLEI